jgi:hypothetical protein
VCARYQAYTTNEPHKGKHHCCSAWLLDLTVSACAGYKLLGEWAKGKKHGAFSFTSNIDGHW